jgi:8-oxo-dGTP pyrophosphatase MutT (NUDIX family)
VAEDSAVTAGQMADGSDEPEMVIPLDRLPPGFAERVADPPADAAPPKPAATAVLVRDAVAGPELLLLKRLRTAGFVPGAYVFPGGRVDGEDAAPELVETLGAMPRGPDPSFWLAAIREVFEETGVLLARRQAPGAAFGAPVAADALHRWRDALLTGAATLLDVLRDLDVVPDISSMVYCSHWITPVAEPKRYDTRFFLAGLPAEATVTVDEREMSDAIWLTPRDALHRFRQGDLPMVFPTVKTIQRLADYDSVDAMLHAFRGADVPPLLPRLVRTSDGVGMVLPGDARSDARGAGPTARAARPDARGG